MILLCFKVTVSETVDERANEPPVKQPKMMLAAKNDAEIARARREKKAFYTLGHIVIFFLICWIPFYLYFLVRILSLPLSSLMRLS